MASLARDRRGRRFMTDQPQSRPFRFGVQSRTLGPRAEWLDTIRRVEDQGYSTFLVLDHFVRGLDPIASLAAAAMVTTSLRLGSMVFDNDFRHPAVLAKAAATIDVLSDGRLELGIGAGWLREEYEQVGIPFDPAGVRIDRMVEAIRFMKRAFVDDPVSFSGTFYEANDLVLPPKPVQQPHPPLLIGGGSKRVLSIAAREADIVSLTNRALPDGSKDNNDITDVATARKVDWVREAAGERFGKLELSVMISRVILTGDRQAAADQIAVDLGIRPEEVLASPQMLIGTVDDMVEHLRQCRARVGISYFVVLEGAMDAVAPVVAQLAGQ
jgi:probable F420-dependent oxidoreductase